MKQPTISLVGSMFVALLLATVGYATADGGAPGYNCCGKNEECRYVDSATECSKGGSGNGCAGTYSYCCADACAWHE